MQFDNSQYELARRERGYTVVEAMVAVTLGMLLVSGVFTFMQMGAQTYVSQGAVSQIQDRGRVAFDILTNQIRMAGYQEASLGGDRLANGLIGVEGGTGQPDSLTVNAQSAALTETSAPLIDCVGNEYPGAVGTPSEGITTMTNAFSLVGDQLRCTNGLGETVTLTANVDDFQLLYGVDSTNDGTPEQYFDADSADMATTVTVSVCLILNSDDNMLAINQTYTDCSGTDVQPDDLRARRVINLMIALRN